jgi:hypothetical protein
MDETCDSERLTSFINHHIPYAKLKAKTKEKLVYILPLERTSEFPGNIYDYDGIKLEKNFEFCHHFCYLMDLHIVSVFIIIQAKLG